MATAPKRKLSTKTYKEKYEIIQYVSEHPEMKRGVVAEHFGIPRTTLGDILKNKAKIIEAIEKGEHPDSRKGGMKRMKQVTFDDVDSALIKWFRQMAAKPEVRIDGEMILLKAQKFAEELGHDDFNKLNASWVNRFKDRWGIGKVLKAGESGGVDTVVVEEWKNGKLKDILQRYKPCDIYNADETGLFWKLLPENTLGFSGTTYHGTKESKQRITILVAGNMDGSDKLPLFVIGKSKQPRAFKNVRRLPVEYRANKKAWMTSELFDSWMSKLDGIMGNQKRKICMIIDNCPAHPAYEYENMEVVFLPPTTTSHTQPMDAGVIRNLKFYYRRILAIRRLSSAETGKPFKWDLLDAVFAIKTAWGQVSQSTVSNCFRSRGFISGTAVAEAGADADHDADVDADNDDINPEDARQFRNVWDSLVDILGLQAGPTMTDYINIDADEDGTPDVMTDAEIVDLVKSVDTSDMPDDDADDVEVLGENGEGVAGAAAVDPQSNPTLAETFCAIDVVRRFGSSLADCPPEILDLAEKVESLLQAEVPKRQRQSTIEEFFN